MKVPKRVKLLVSSTLAFEPNAGFICFLGCYDLDHSDMINYKLTGASIPASARSQVSNKTQEVEKIALNRSERKTVDI